MSIQAILSFLQFLVVFLCNHLRISPMSMSQAAEGRGVLFCGLLSAGSHRTIRQALAAGDGARLLGFFLRRSSVRAFMAPSSFPLHILMISFVSSLIATHP